LQRRHQKVLEEGPAPGLPAKLLETIAAVAVKGCQAIGYSSAGTLEFLVDTETNDFYFIEMNTRIQVEHPVTELITGVDLVAWQIRVAAGERLTLQQKEVRIGGHAIECRINAEDPARGFLPQAGVVELYLPPGGVGVRVDSHLYSGYTAPASYDSLLGKLIVWGQDRDEAIARMRRALAEYIIVGPTTTIPFQQAILRHPAFGRGEVHVGFLAQWMDELVNGAPLADAALAPPETPGPRAKEQRTHADGQAPAGDGADRAERAGDHRQPDDAGDSGRRQNGRGHEPAPRRRRAAKPQPGPAGSE
jgi:acetyl-CoA carboxylase biotin carboxylase subunit